MWLLRAIKTLKQLPHLTAAGLNVHALLAHMVVDDHVLPAWADKAMELPACPKGRATNDRSYWMSPRLLICS